MISILTDAVPQFGAGDEDGEGDARRSRQSRRDADRGQAETLGFALLVGITVIGAVLVFVFGTAALGETRQTAEVANSEHAMKEFDARVTGVALGDSPVRQADLAQARSDSFLRTDPDRGRIEVDIVNATTGATEYDVTNVTMGVVEADHGETTVAYQGGGVWRGDDGGSVMVSRPEVKYRNGSLTLPVIVLDGDGSVYSRVEVTKNGTEQRFPGPEANTTNKLRDLKVRITIQSEYYDAWGRYFEDSTNAYVEYRHDDETAIITFLALPPRLSLGSGIVATADAGRLELAGTGAYTDSYDSSVGPYAATKNSNGTVEAVGDVYMTGNSEIRGNVRSGSHVEMDGTSAVYGDVHWTDSKDLNPDNIDGEIKQIDGIATIEPIDRTVYASVDALRAENNNSETSVVSGGSIELSNGESATLTAGSYHVDHIWLDGGDLTIDTTDGDVTIAVEDWIKLSKNSGSKLKVKGDGVVRFYVASQGETAVSITGLGERHVNLHVGKKTAVTVPGDDSPQLRLYSTRDFKATVSGPDASFTGVIYAPAGRYGTGYVYVKQGHVYGATVAGSITIGQSGAIHYDEAISTVPLPRSPEVARIEYLHASVHRVNVTAA